jgi:hypothetical protein
MKMELPAMLRDVLEAVEITTEPTENLPEYFGDVLAALLDDLVLNIGAEPLPAQADERRHGRRMG